MSGIIFNDSIRKLTQNSFVKTDDKKIKWNHLLIHVVASRDEEKALSYIQNAFRTKPNFFRPFLDLQFTEDNISPVILSAILNKPRLTQCLIELGANTETPDRGGNRVGHYLALNAENVDSMAYKILMDLNPKPISNKKGYTWKKILDLRLNPDPTKSVVYFLDSKTKKVVKGNGKDFLRMAHGTGAKYYMDNVPHLNFGTVWKTRMDCKGKTVIPSIPEQFGWRKELPQKYEEYRNLESPPVYMEILPKVGCNIVARKRLSVGTIAGELIGAEKQPRTSQDIYGKSLMEQQERYGYDTDETYSLKTYRSLAAQANDGFPNAICICWQSPDGSVKTLLVIITEIEEGESITWDYGPLNLIKQVDHLELQKEPLKNFIRKIYKDFSHVSNPLLAAYIQFNSESQPDLDKLALSAHMGYLLYTPSAVLYLFKQEGLIRMDHFVELFNVATHPCFSISDGKEIHNDFKNFYERLLKIETIGKEKILTMFSKYLDEESFTVSTILDNLGVILEKYDKQSPNFIPHLNY